MNCFSHPDITSVSTCLNCGKGLCITCTSYYTSPMCATCHRDLKRDALIRTVKELLTVILLSALIVLLIFAYIPDKDPKSVIFHHDAFLGKLSLFTFAYSPIAIVVGWKALNKLTANYFLFLPLIGWIVYFIIKLYAAFFVGIFYTPVWFIKKFAQLIKFWSIRD